MPPARSTTRQHLITTRAQPSVCRHCGAAILIGLSEGLNVRADLHRADRQGQALAVILRRAVYTLINRTLVERVDPLLHWPILIEHRCGHPIGILWVPPAAQDHKHPPY